MIGVQDQNTVHGALEHRIDFVLFARRGEHHAQEVAGVGEVIARINKRLADRILVTHGCHGRHFGQQAIGGDFTVTRVIHVEGVVIERRQGAGDPAHNGHRVRIATERMEQTGDLLMDHGVTGHGGFEFVIFGLGWFFTVQQNVTNFKIV